MPRKSHEGAELGRKSREEQERLRLEARERERRRGMEERGPRGP